MGANYYCEEGCGVSTAAECSKWKECYAADFYEDTRKQIQECVDKLKQGWTWKLGGGMNQPKI